MEYMQEKLLAIAGSDGDQSLTVTSLLNELGGEDVNRDGLAQARVLC